MYDTGWGPKKITPSGEGWESDAISDKIALCVFRLYGMISPICQGEKIIPISPATILGRITQICPKKIRFSRTGTPPSTKDTLRCLPIDSFQTGKTDPAMLSLKDWHTSVRILLRYVSKDYQVKCFRKRPSKNPA